MTLFKRLYRWVSHWAKTPYGSIALFILAFAESIFFPVPADVLLILLVMGCSVKAFQYALICTIGSVAGALVGYSVGYFTWLQLDGSFTGFANFFFDNIPGFSVSLYNSIKVLYEQWGFWVIFTAGFTPIPFKVFTITAGVFDLNLLMFLLASVIGKGARFFIVAFLIWKYGSRIKQFIEKYFNLLALGLTTFIIGGFAVIKYVL